MRFICSILLIGIGLLLTSSARGQEYGTVTGKLVTSDEQPAPAIRVILNGTRYAALTDETGSFSIKAPGGSYTLLVQSLGNEETAVPLVIQNGARTAVPLIRLSQSSRQLPEIVVTGQYEAQSLKNSVYKVRTISREIIEMRNATDVQGVLNNELGIRFSTDYTLGETDINIMGMSGQNVKILLDGVPLIDRGGSRQSLSQIDINTIERIELVEGPMSVMYGTDALAGVINIITKKNKSSNSLRIGARLQEETAGKEYDAFTGKGVHNQNLNVNWSHRSGLYAGGSYTRNNFGGWQGSKTGREQEWRPKDQTFGTATAGIRTQQLNAWYRLDYLTENINTPGAVYDNKATDQEFITNRYTHIAQADWTINSKWLLNGSASYQNYERRTRTTDIDLTTGRRTLNTHIDGGQDLSSFKTTFIRANTIYKASGQFTLHSGLEIKSDQTKGQRIKGNPSINDYALFVSAEIKPYRFINIRPGARFSVNSVYDAPPVIPSVNTKFSLAKDWDLRLSYARGFRAPALRELYFDFHDANHSINGNSNLKAEYSNSFAGSLTWQALEKNQARLTSTLSGFYNDFNNRIDIAGNVDPANPNEYYYINISKYKTTGATWENMLIWKSLQASLGFSYIGRYNNYYGDASYDDNKSLAKFVWSPEVNSTITYRFAKPGIRLGLFYKYTGTLPQYQLVTLNNQQTLVLGKVKGFHSADFTASKTLGKYITVSTGVKNIFNVTRVTNSIQSTGGAHSTGGNQLKAYGTSWFLGLAFQLNK